jgi:hypothetical protein
MINDKSEYQKILLIKEFQTQLVLFLDELIAQFPTEGDLILIRIFIKDQIPMADVLGRYQRDILPFEHKITNRDDKFFLEHPFLYTRTPIGDEKVNHFKDLWTKNILSPEDKDTVWTWMDAFNKIAKKYIQNFGYIAGWEPKNSSTAQVIEKNDNTNENNVKYNNNIKCENGVCYLR